VNDSRNPFKDIEYYILPLAVGMAAFVLRWIADTSCSSWSTTCARASDSLGHVYASIFFFILIVSAGRIKQFMAHMMAVLPVLSGVGIGMSTKED
jgi:atlastin